jgi:hypothetical protein
MVPRDLADLPAIVAAMAACRAAHPRLKVDQTLMLGPPALERARVDHALRAAF